jgi:trimethylamine---corrinoid protein Co-methyltransferase
MTDTTVTEDCAPRSRRGSGGRAARKAARAAPLPDNMRPVRPGLEGGTFRPFSDGDMDKIHNTAMRALEEVGLADAPPSGVEILKNAGAVQGDDGRIRFSRALVEDMVAIAARDITLHGQDQQYDIRPGGHRVHYGTAGAAVFVYDPVTRENREPTVQDLYNSARIVDTLDNIHFFQRTLTPRDTVDPRDMDLNTLYACVSGTTKHAGTSFTTAENAARGLEMLHMIAGSEKAWRERPFVSNSNCFVVPPMKFATESCLVMETLIRGGMPILLLSAGQAGATAPAPLAGAVVQAVAECLAGVVYVNAMQPGHPAIFGTWPFVSDLRTGAMSGGSPEQGLLTAACGQMARYYDLPGGSACAMSDSKEMDMQAGYERGMANVMAGLSGLNMVYESVGMHASLLSHCLEALLVDNDIIGACLRCVRGIEVNDDTMALETMKEVCMGGPGHYLGAGQTLSVMQTEYIYPTLGDRTSPKEWLEVGKPDLIEAAIGRKNTLLAEHFPGHISDEVDQAIRANFDIFIPREGMKPSA